MQNSRNSLGALPERARVERPREGKRAGKGKLADDYPNDQSDVQRDAIIGAIFKCCPNTRIVARRPLPTQDDSRGAAVTKSELAPRVKLRPAISCASKHHVQPCEQLSLFYEPPGGGI
jgi:hypothetical protein